MRIVSVQVNFIIKMKAGESYDSVCNRARAFLVEHAETIPMLYEEEEPTDEDNDA